MAFRRGDTCDGHLIATFDLKQVPTDKDLWLDYKGAGVAYVKINGQDFRVSDVFKG